MISAKVAWTLVSTINNSPTQESSRRSEESFETQTTAGTCLKATTVVKRRKIHHTCESMRNQRCKPETF